MADFDYSDARAVQRESRQREALIDLKLRTELEWSSAWLRENCWGDGFEPHPLLAGPNGWQLQAAAVTMSGEIQNGRGVHSQATFRHELRRVNSQGRTGEFPRTGAT